MISLLPVLTILFCLGIFIGDKLGLRFTVFYAVSLFSAVGCVFFLRKKTIFQLFLFCLVLFLGASVIKNSQVLYKNNIKRLVFYGKSNAYLVKGVVASDPE